MNSRHERAPDAFLYLELGSPGEDLDASSLGIVGGYQNLPATCYFDHGAVTQHGVVISYFDVVRDGRHRAEYDSHSSSSPGSNERNTEPTARAAPHWRFLAQAQALGTTALLELAPHILT
ncbi:MAG TPA: hypothetical protein VHW01_07435 [Polyangiaceae bacterium]|nr:hypothetical protein [Polyangiaceae bacterium]